MPVWGLVLIFVGGAIFFGVLGFTLVRAVGFRSPSTGLDTMVSAFSTRATTLFGILLVFVIVSEYQSYGGTQKTVRDEATNLAEIVRNTQSFPAGPRERIRAAVARYGNEVVHREWDAMKKGQVTEAASTDLDGIQHALASYSPSKEADKQFLGAAVSNFGGLVNARRDRIAAARNQIPVALLALLFAGAGIFIVTMFGFTTGKDALVYTLIVLLSGLTGAGLFATIVLDYPFTGVLTLSTQAFHEGALRTLITP
jgi:Protein of unknown function (DUF4239)